MYTIRINTYDSSHGNRIGDVMLARNVVRRGFEPPNGLSHRP
jgi:hypothetical protein